MSAPDQDLVLAIAAELGVDPSYVEKDWQAMRLVAAVAGVGYGEVRPVFAGGTSLSKAFGLIKRFSEDLDFRLALPEAGLIRWLACFWSPWVRIGVGPVEQDGMNAAGAKRGSKTGVRRPDKGRAGAVSRRRVQIAAILAVAGVVGAAFVLTPRPDAALFLWNDSPSMDTGIYRKTETRPGRGSIVSFEIPEAARL